jgi:UDPglucose 6-dehydrogenase
LGALVAKGMAAGRLHFDYAASELIEQCSVVFLCVSTPPAPDGSADLSLLMAAVSDIKDRLAKRAVVVNKSTVPVGTAEAVAVALGRPDVAVVSNPEFLRQGTAVHDFLHPDRVVVGGPPRAVATVARLYSPLKAPVIKTDARTAELMKYGANAFLATKLSFANAMAALSEELGADGAQVLAGIGADARIGPAFLHPGPGGGGSCFPEDCLALLATSKSAGHTFDLLREVIRINDDQTDRVVRAVTKLVGGSLTGRRLAVWGVSFKAGTGDTRQSPALRVIDRLVAAGASVTAYDPAATPAPAGLKMASSALAACGAADALVVLTEWPEFARVDPVAVSAALAAPRLADARGIVDAPAYRAIGFNVWQIGHGYIQ